MDNTQFLTDTEITEKYHVKTGEGQYGKWDLWNIYVKGFDGKMSYFSGGKKPKPEKGMKLKMLRYETTYDGEYTNHKVIELFVDNAKSTPQTSSGAIPASKTQSKGNGKEICQMSFIGGFVKDLLVEYMDGGEGSFGNIMKTYREECQKTYDAFNLIPTSSDTYTLKDDDQTSYTDNEPPPHGDEDIPF